MKWLAYHEGQTINTEQMNRETGTRSTYLKMFKVLSSYGLVTKYPMSDRYGAQWRWVVEEHQVWRLIRDADKLAEGSS